MRRVNFLRDEQVLRNEKPKPGRSAERARDRLVSRERRFAPGRRRWKRARRAALATAPRPRQSVRVPRVVDVESRCSLARVLALRALRKTLLVLAGVFATFSSRTPATLSSACLFSSVSLSLWLDVECCWLTRARAILVRKSKKKVVQPDGCRRCRRLGPCWPVIARAESAFYLFADKDDDAQDEEAQLGQFGVQPDDHFAVGFGSCGQNRHNWGHR